MVVTNVEDELQKRPEGAPRAFFLNSGAAAMTFDCGKQSSSRRLVKLKETLAEAAPAREERASKVGRVRAGDTSKKQKEGEFDWEKHREVRKTCPAKNWNCTHFACCRQHG